MTHSNNAHAARIDETNIVREVIVIPYSGDNDVTITAYCNDNGLPGVWLDTSYTGARRKRAAGIGYTYDTQLDEFVPPGWELVDGEWIAPQVEAPIEP